MADQSGATVRVLAAIVVAIVIVALAGIVAVALGIGPFAGSSVGDGGTPVTTGANDGGTPVTTEATATASGGDGNATESRPPFSFTIDRIKECGRTCRDVTATLHNNQNQPARNATVVTRIYAGNSTEQGDRIWKGTESIGAVAAGGSATRTQRVKLSMSEAFAVQRNDGWITIDTTVTSTETTVSFRDRRDVA